MTSEPIRVFIGYDPDEDAAYHVCRRSLLEHASAPVCITPLVRDALMRATLYTRPMSYDGRQRHDGRDGRPFSSEFSFSRFLVPAVSLYQGWALYCDSDFLWREDIAELWRLRDPGKALMLVKHDYRPEEKTKMRGKVAQAPYPRKNWSSLMLFNCEHEAIKNLTPWEVNWSIGARLHQFRWLDEHNIGGLPEEWNWLEGWSDTALEPKVVHFTRGTPDVPGCEDTPFADEWLAWAGQR